MSDFRFDSRPEFNIENVGFIKVERKKDHIFDNKYGKKQYSFIFIEQGSLEYTFYSKKMLVSEGCFLFIPKNMPYKTKYISDKSRVKNILFDLSGVAPVFLRDTFFKYSVSIQEVFNKLNDTNNFLLLTARLYEIFYLLQNESLFLEKMHRKIMPAIKEMNKNYFENHKISFYAKLCNMSESNFRKVFRECVKKTPIEYRNHIRIREFKKLIASGEFTVSEGAYTVGFNNMSFFYEVFSRYEGQKELSLTHEMQQIDKS